MARTYTINALKLNLSSGSSESELRCYIINDDTFVVGGADKRLDYYPIYYLSNGNFFVFHGMISNVRPATKREISDVGLWDFVINKDD